MNGQFYDGEHFAKFILQLQQISIDCIYTSNGLSKCLLTFVSFPCTILKLSSDSLRLIKLLSFNVWMLELENWRCLICSPFGDDDANKSFVNPVIVLSKS